MALENYPFTLDGSISKSKRQLLTVDMFVLYQAPSMFLPFQIVLNLFFNIYAIVILWRYN
jgi:hypothetical protein